jgi:hypothetical protein
MFRVVDRNVGAVISFSFVDGLKVESQNFGFWHRDACQCWTCVQVLWTSRSLICVSVIFNTIGMLPNTFAKLIGVYTCLSLTGLSFYSNMATPRTSYFQVVSRCVQYWRYSPSPHWPARPGAVRRAPSLTFNLRLFQCFLLLKFSNWVHPSSSHFTNSSSYHTKTQHDRNHHCCNCVKG